jgi:hypothetical protein
MRPSFRQGGTNSFRRLPSGLSVPQYLYFEAQEDVIDWLELLASFELR